MRWLIPLAAVALGGCAHLAGSSGTPTAPLEVSADGLTATAGGERWTAPAGVVFFQRGEVLHVVSTLPGRRWDVSVPVGPDGRLAWPAEGPIVAAGGILSVRSTRASPAIATLIDGGQLYPHDDHYHLTHRLEDEDWQALYRDRADDSPLPPLRRQVAATVLAMLVDERIPGTSPGATEEGLRRIRSTIGKVRRAVEGNVAARAIEAIVRHGLEIRDDGRTLEIEGKVYRAGEGIRFAYCSAHFHVEDAGGKWATPVEIPDEAPGAFAWPRSIFYEVAADGTVGARPATTRWRKLLDAGEVRFTRDHWHVTETYANPRLQGVLKAVSDPRLSEAQRDRARGLALELMSLRLETGSEAEFDARLAAVDRAIDRAAEALDRDLRAAPRR